MIRIGRGEEPAALREARWWRLAQAREERRKGALSEDFFDGWEGARETLYDRQMGLCAFCEMRLLLRGSPVEHFRPKQRVVRIDWTSLEDGADEVDQHRFRRGLPPIERSGLELIRWQREEGYWWLAWTWDNLFFGCTSCNSGYKSTRFPLADGSPVARTLGDAIGDERPLLLDPSVDRPMDHIQFRCLAGKWTPGPRDGSPRGAWTIALLGLADPDHLDHYTSHVAPFAEDLRTLRERVRSALDDPDRAGKGAAVEAWNTLRGKVFEPRQPFRSLMWDVLDDAVPEAQRCDLGLDHPRPDAHHPDPPAAQDHDPKGIEDVTDDELRWSLRCVWPNSTRTDALRTVLERACHAAPRGLAWFASVLGRSEETVRDHLEALVGESRLVRNADSAYAPPPTAPTAPR